MNKFVLDSDGLIKLTKSGALEQISESLECYISEEVHRECVIEGKNRFHDDAFQIDTFVDKNKIKFMKVNVNSKAQSMLKDKKCLGEGEKSSLHLFFNIRAKAIITDDQAFLNLLYRNNISFIIPSDLIARLSELRILSKDEGLLALERIKSHVRESNYTRARNNIGLIVNNRR